MFPVRGPVRPHLRLGLGEQRPHRDNIKARRVLEDKGDTRVVYDQLEPPIVSHRDFAFTLHKTPGGPQRCAIDFYLSNEKAPPLPDGWVRMSKLKGSWRFERTAKGSHVVYTNFSDPEAPLPPVFVHGSQRDAAVQTIKKGIRLAHDPDPHADAKPLSHCARVSRYGVSMCQSAAYRWWPAHLSPPGWCMRPWRLRGGGGTRRESTRPRGGGSP